MRHTISRRAKLLGLVAVVLAAVVVAVYLYSRHAGSVGRAARAAGVVSAAVAQGVPILRVPHAGGAITLDGDTDDPGWVKAPGPAKTGAFLLENGDPAVPYSQARLVWGDDYLYVALLASDEDVESRVDRNDAPIGPDDDVIRIVFSQDDTEYAFDVSPNAMITDSIRRGGDPWDVAWSSGAHASKDLAATVNDPTNLDEEWEIELAIPLSSLGMAGERGETIGVSFHRCDTPKESARVCAGWGDGAGGRPRGRLVLE